MGFKHAPKVPRVLPALLLCAAAVSAQDFMDGRRNQLLFDESGPLRFSVQRQGASSGIELDVVNVIAPSKEKARQQGESDVVRRFYDGRRRLVREEHWHMARRSDKCVFSDEIVYIYDGDAELPSSSLQRYFADNKQVQRLYTGQGRLLQECTSFTDSSGAPLNDRALRVDWAYDSENRVTERTEVTGIPALLTKSEVYKYDGSGGRPDYSYYENGKIRIRIVYSDRSSYVQTTYFDDGYSVEASYAHGIKQQERYLLHGREIRQGFYEKAQ